MLRATFRKIILISYTSQINIQIFIERPFNYFVFYFVFFTVLNLFRWNIRRILSYISLSTIFSVSHIIFYTSYEFHRMNVLQITSRMFALNPFLWYCRGVMWFLYRFYWHLTRRISVPIIWWSESWDHIDFEQRVRPYGHITLRILCLSELVLCSAASFYN